MNLHRILSVFALVILTAIPLMAMQGDKALAEDEHRLNLLLVQIPDKDFERLFEFTGTLEQLEVFTIISKLHSLVEDACPTFKRLVKSTLEEKFGVGIVEEQFVRLLGYLNADVRIHGVLDIDIEQVEECLRCFINLGADINIAFKIILANSCYQYLDWNPATPVKVVPQFTMRVFQFLKEQGVDLRTHLPYLPSALHLAACIGLPDMVHYLLREGLDVNECVIKRESNEILNWSNPGNSLGENPETISEHYRTTLLILCRDMRKLSEYIGVNALLGAIKFDRCDIIRILMQAHASLDFRQQIAKDTLLNRLKGYSDNPHFTPSGEDERSVKSMAVNELATQINNVETLSLSPLALAVLSLNGDVVSVLLDNNALNHDRAEDQPTALTIALASRNEEMVRMLLSRGLSHDYFNHISFNMTALGQALCSRNEPFATLLLQGGAPVNIERGIPPILIAIANSSIEMIEKLITQYSAKLCTYRLSDKEIRSMSRCPNKAAVDALNQLIAQGLETSALASSVNRGDLSIACLLQQCGMDFKTRLHRGLTSLMIAAIAGHEEIVDYLIKQQVAIDSIGEDKQTALSCGVFSNKCSIVEKLLNAGAGIHINTRNFDGLTPLMLACIIGNCDMVKRLLAAGADTSICTNDNSTAKELARKFGHSEIVKLLEPAVLQL